MSKSDKVNQILSLNGGKPYKVIKARPSLDFKLIDKEESLFRCLQTGQTFTWKQVQEKFIVDINRYWGSCSIADCPEGDELYFTSIWLRPIARDEIFFPTEPLVYNNSIHVDIADYVEGEPTIL